MTEIFTFKLYCDLETGVRGHSRSLKVAHTTLYLSSIVNMLLSTIFEIYPYIGRKSLHSCIRRPLAKPSDLRNDPWWRKTRMMGLTNSEKILTIRSTVLIQISLRVWWTDRRTDRIAVAYTSYSRIVACSKKKKLISIRSCLPHSEKI